MSDFATVDDVIALWRDLSIEERERISALLPVVSDSLREEARKVGKNLDEMIAEHPTLGNVARSVTVDVVARAIMTPSNEAPMTQLGLRRQKIGVIEPYGTAWNNGNTL